MDIENVSNFRRRVLSTSVRSVDGAGVAMFAVTGVAFLWHQAVGSGGWWGWLRVMVKGGGVRLVIRVGY